MQPLLVLILQAAELQACVEAQRDLSEHIRQLLLDQLVPGQGNAKLDPGQEGQVRARGRTAAPSPGPDAPGHLPSCLSASELTLALHPALHCSEGLVRPSGWALESPLG